MCPSFLLYLSLVSFREKSFKNKIVKGSLAGVQFPDGFYSPGKTRNPKEHPAQGQGNRSFCVVIVGYEIRFGKEIQEQMAWKIVHRMEFPVIPMKIHRQLSTTDVRTEFPVPQKCQRVK